MKTYSNIETIGVLLKEEMLQTVEHCILENTLVLENIEPFPGYHGINLPRETKPDSLFLITDRTYPIEKIFRTSQHICCNPDLAMDACPVEISFMNATYSGIRIKQLSDYSHIAKLQQCYQEKEIGFMKYKIISMPGTMYITKIFRMTLMDDYIYRDLNYDHTYYITIPYHFEWTAFRNTTVAVKNNMDNSNFDCAYGFLYLQDMFEFVRIYALNMDTKKLKMIRQKYLEQIIKIRDDATYKYKFQ